MSARGSAAGVPAAEAAAEAAAETAETAAPGAPPAAKTDEPGLTVESARGRGGRLRRTVSWADAQPDKGKSLVAVREFEPRRAVARAAYWW